MTPTAEVVKVIDAKIAEMENELEKLRRAAELLPVVSTNLVALRRARALLLGEPINGETPAPSPSNGTKPARTIVVRPSQATAILEIIHEAGRALHANELTTMLTARGFNTTRATVEGQAARFVKEGKLARVGPSTFAIDV